MAERSYGEAPALGQGMRQQMTDALYQRFYANAMPREQYDQQMAGKSDLDVANVAYETFYSGQLERPEFNAQVGLTSAAGSTQRAVTSGMTFGLADEAGAAAAGLAGLVTGEGFGSAYSRSRDAQRNNAEVYRQNNPYLGRGLEIAGGLASGAPAARVPPGAGGLVAPSMGRNIANTATLGAIGGAGDAEGGVEERLQGAAIGGGLGAGMAAVLPLALRVGSGAVGQVARAAGLGNDARTASQMLLRALQDDGLTPRQAMERLTEWQRAGAKPETLFDVAGENTRRLARTAAGRSGPGTERAVQFLADRQEGQLGRVADDAAAGLGQNADDFHARLNGLQETRRTAAAPLYERAWNTRVPHTVHDELAPFVSDRIGQQALQRGMRVIELESLAQRRPFDPAEYGVVRGENGEWALQGRMQNLRLLDAVKRGFDDIVEGFRDPTSGRLNLDQYGRAVNDVRAEYVGALRDRFPTYGRALDAWGGPSQSMDAMGRGRNLFTLRDSEAAQAVQQALRNPGDADFFRLGVAQAVQDRIASAPDGADAVKRIFGSPAKRALLRTAFPDQATYSQFEAQMRREAAMYRNGQFVSPRTGSQTQLREADAGDMGEAALNIGLSAIGLGGQSPRNMASQFFFNRAAGARGITPQVAEQLSTRLFNAEPGEIGRVLTRLDSTQRKNVMDAYLQAQREAAAWRGVTAGAVQAQ